MKQLSLSHIGVPVKEKFDGMAYREGLGLWSTDPSDSPLHIEYMFFEADTPLPPSVQKMPHIAYRTDDLEAALPLIGKVIYGPEKRPTGSIILFSRLDDLLLEVVVK